MPLSLESITSKKFALDPVKDQSFRKEKKLLQKYKGRSLLLATSACAMHCRFCFRQNFPYEKKISDFSDELKRIAGQKEINEIILSGGDPLSLDDTKLQQLIQDLNTIPHIKRLRFHTRFPIGIPERIDESFLSCLASSKQQIYFVLHVNHPKELDNDVFFHLKKLQALGVVLLSQSVLLKEINDDVKTLSHLFESLSDHGIIPYYLHRLDKIQGGAHFEVDTKKGIELIQKLRNHLSGYSVPRFVEEVPGHLSKDILI